MQTGINSVVIMAIMALLAEPVRSKCSGPRTSNRTIKKQARKTPKRKPKQTEVA
jgi:hypothetical protein